MKVLDVLRKLGILRFGAEAGTYKKATDRPASLQFEEVFDSQKDVVTRKDVRELVDGRKGQ